MKKTISMIAACALLSISGAASAGVSQTWSCTLHDGQTGDDFTALSQRWLDAAKGINEDASVQLYFPVAGERENMNIIFVFTMPDFEAWGAFEDAYPGSPVAAVDATWDENSECGVSTLWYREDLE